ncbi:teichoic acid transport system permease protein [Paenibacillus forsythiae]|uniref:Teichoic acid transport system permease protein n=1 Tax=Paenibacillus forsythiae TaxID=365616 RepID=A0ABU3HDQ5_9BACL|nr:ABC transporter permease [Paenibacillus forsythiae]MDT3428870.1 teichoic acid transport system permease protein [Paenibacillus forsythiae]
MKSLRIIFKEHIKNLYMIFSLSLYELKIAYVSNRLGLGWMVLNPVIQIAVYWSVFGLGIRGGAPVHGVPFFVWLICGLIPWFYTSGGIIQGSNSVYTKLATASKMNFPLSIIPTLSIISQLYTHLILLVVIGIIIAFSHGLTWMSLPGVAFYCLSLTCFLVGLSFLTSTLSTIVRDVHLLVQTAARMLFFLTPVMWVMNAKTPQLLQDAINLNPIYYIINGYRSSLLYGNLNMIWSLHTLYFWGITLVLFLIGGMLHIRLRRQFVDYL